MRTFMKKPLSMLLALVMLAGLLPMQAFASGSDTNPWSGRSAVFVGDSITAGVGTTKVYSEFLEESLGFGSVISMGVGGSCISAASDYGQSNQPLINRYQNIPSADLIVVFMGTNDYGHETPLGTVNDAGDGTFYGALNVIVPALAAKHTSGKLVFVTPLHRYGFGTSAILGTQFTSDDIANGVGASLGDYVDALKTVCANHGVSVIDLYTECTLDPSDAETRTTYMPDGLHPNAAGHEVIAGIMDSHIRGYEPAQQEPIELTEMVYGNRFAAGHDQTCRASSRINYYLKAGTVITLRDPDVMQWACTKTSDETGSGNLGYFPDSGWSDKETAVVEADGWVGFVFKYRDETRVFDLTKPLSDYITIVEPVSWDDVNTDALYNTITVTPGQLMPEGTVVENEIYGYVVNYPLKKGHVLSISNTNYVFSVRKLADGNFSTMLKQATTDSFTATEDMTVAMLIRKPDKSALTAEELASIVIYDSQYGMIGVEGSAHRFTVEAETIDGGTATTRAAIFLPPSYSESGTPTRLIIMTNGGSAYLTDSSWQGNTEANRNLVEFYLQNGYAVLVNDNTAAKVVNSTSEMVPDLGCLQQLSGLMKSYEYVCNTLNLERQFSIHARSQGTFVGIRIIREFPGLVKCALITGPNVSAAHRWTVITNKDHTAERFGFADLTGGTFEADKFVGNDIYTDMAADDYSLLPTFWMESSNDVCPNNNASIYEVVERLRELGCTAEYQKFSDLTHSETCRLASEEAMAAALAFLEQYQESHTHTYTATVTAPTCTAQGYTTYTCDCGDSYVADFVDATGHSYENGICTGCGAEHPNLANYKGKVISILGDSISTFAGYIPTADGFNLEHYARYPQDNLFTEVEHTWWMQVLTALDAKLGINESWRSTEVYNYIDAEVNSSYDGTKACMASITRIQNLGSNGTPDVILFFGGTNDITQSRPVGTFDPSTAPKEVDLTSVKWDTVADAYVDAIMRMQYYYPEAQIVAMLPFDRNSQGTAKVDQYNSLFISICEHYGVPYVDLRECGISNADLPDGTHPDATGMDYITAAVMDVLMSDCYVEAGEHIVHSVTHNLTGAKSSLSYYKGISHGNSFVTTITGENLKVTVTMGGVDVTSDYYANGVVSVENVTDDIVINAVGIEKTVYEDYLQQLPENFCSGTNLWTALVPINLYYTGSGWGNTASGSVYSVTIPVAAGDQIWATSFQKSGTNGGSRNGIRLTWFDENGVLESVSPDNVYAEFSADGYLTAPEGAIAVNVVMWNGNESNEIYIINRDHTYSNGMCTLCGAEHPNLANFEGKVISILGGSTCTFEGYIPVADGFNLTHRSRYPQSNLLTDVNDTWWMQIVDELDAKLGINDSWAGSQVLNTLDSNSSDLGPDAAMASLTRILNLGANGTPDVILFYGAMNDIGRAVRLGSFDAATAPTQVDLAATKWDNLADAYVAAIMRMQHYYPDTQIVAMLPGPTASYYTEAERQAYCEVLKAICDHYGVPTVDLSTCGLTTSDMPDGTHPNAKGMDYITAAVLETLLSECEMESGENVVHSVTHVLSGAESSLCYYKGVSHNKPFVTAVTGEEVTVAVTMGGVDITDQVYADGKITISAVTGDIVITAKGIYNADGHLQQLPDIYCCNTNLWTLLEPVNEYYTASGWGNNSNSNYSVTFPVTAGDHIWATSFGAAGTNGYAANAVRITWFGKDGVLKSLGRDVVYAEFAEHGCITVPDGAVAVNIPMASNADHWEIYILNRDHCYEHGICTLCGEDSVTAALEGNTLSLSGELAVGTKILVSCYNGERFAGTKILVWQGQPLQETIPEGDHVKLLFVDENWLPLRKPVIVK